MNWFVKVWTTPLINREEETPASEETEYSSESNYYQQESEPVRASEQRAPGMFDWFWGTPEQESEPQQRHHQEPASVSNELNIQGDDEFVRKVTTAYNYLDAEDQASVRENTRQIIQHARVSGAFPVNRIIMLGGEVLERDLKSIAGVLRHEAHHMTYGEVANSQNEELDCIQKQIAALRKIGGCEAEIAALERADGLHYLDS